MQPAQIPGEDGHLHENLGSIQDSLDASFCLIDDKPLKPDEMADPYRRTNKNKSSKGFNPNKDEFIIHRGCIYVGVFWDCRNKNPDCSCETKKHHAFFRL